MEIKSNGSITRKTKNYFRRLFSLFIKPPLTRQEARRESSNQIEAKLDKKLKAFRIKKLNPLIGQEQRKIKKLDGQLKLLINSQSFNTPLLNVNFSEEINEMIKIRKYSSAWAKLSGYSFWHLSIKAKMQYLTCGQSFNKGASTDLLFTSFLFDFDFEENFNYLGLVGERLICSGLKMEVKRDYFNKCFDIIKEVEHPKKSTIYSQLLWCEFKLSREQFKDVNVLDYFDSNDFRLSSLGYQARYIPFLEMAGYSDTYIKYIHAMFNEHGIENDRLNGLVLTYIPSLILDDESVFSDFYARSNNNFSLISILKNISSSSPKIESLLMDILENLNDTFIEANLVKKDAILRILLKADLIETALVLSEKSKQHVQLLPYLTSSGFEYLVRDDYHAAKDCFLTVLEEDPSDTLASSGLRFAIPRAGSDFSYFNYLRERLGYGIASKGRTGVSAIGSENTIALLMQGRYAEGLYTKKYSYHWQLMKSKYSSKFLNFEEIPNVKKCKEKTLFVVGDEGVGDEVRTAQFYQYLSDIFREVVITCDPRLFATLSHSFPKINFIPVKRLRKDVVEFVEGEPERLTGYDQKIFSLLTKECAIYLDKCDYITFGQNLFYNNFINKIPKLEFGVSYLKSPVCEKKATSFRVGLLWRSHYRSRMRDFMYMSVDELKPILGIENVNYVSLQHSIDNDEIQFCKNNGIELIEDIDLFNDFDSMIERFSQLDLVIGISSLPIELSAAIGIPVWMLGITPENFFLRTTGGKDSTDRYTLNSKVISAKSFDFSEPRKQVVEKTVLEAKSQLEDLVKSRYSTP